MMTVDSIGDDNFIRLIGREIPRELFFAGLFYLLYFASFGSLFPLLAVYFKQLGLNPTQASKYFKQSLNKHLTKFCKLKM